MKRPRLFHWPWRTTRQLAVDVDDELRFHLDMRTHDLVAQGLDPAAARAEALRQFGDLEDARAYLRALDHDIETTRRRRDHMNELRQDLLYALRKLRAAPLFTLTVVLTLALGIGANTAIFSVVNGVLIRALPFPRADRLVRLEFTMHGSPDAGSPPELRDFRSRSRMLNGVAMYSGTIANLVRPDGEAARLVGVEVSSNWFDVLRVRPLLGRGFRAGEDNEGAAKVVVLSEGTWRRDFGADPAIVGRGVRVNGETRTVVGVMPAGRAYPLTTEVWLPFVLSAEQLGDDQRGARWVAMLGRLRDGATLDAARVELSAIAHQTEAAFPARYRQFNVRPVPLQEAMVGELRRPMLVIMGAVALVLLIACANVANLMLVRATAREGELAIRTALGAGRGRLTRQLVTESLLLTLVGGGLGIGLARLAMKLLLYLAPPSLPQLQSARIDPTTLVLTAVIAVVTGLLFGVLPALQTPRASLAEPLRAGARGTRGLPSAHRIKRGIVVVEVALAVVLLAGAGLLLRSFRQLLSVDPGFRPEGVLVFRVALPDRTYDTSDAIRNFATSLDERLRAIPGVRQVGIANALPLDGSDFHISFTIHGRPPVPKNEEPSAQIVTATPGFTRALGIPVLSGRAISEDDRAGAPQVVVVSRSFLRKHFPHEVPLGHYVELGWSENGVRRGGTIVGVVGDVKQYGLDQDAEPTIYLPFAQAPYPSLRIVLRTAIPPASIAPAARQAVRATDRELPVFALRTMEEHVAASVEPQRFYATLVALFASVALVLAAVGLYGIVAYAVGQRTHELGIRVALGATRQGLAAMVVREGILLALAGIAIGLAVALGVSRLLRGLLFGVSATDPVTYVAVPILLVIVAAVASFVPGRRAASVDPTEAIRGE